jgi:hypothetical protein
VIAQRHNLTAEALLLYGVPYGIRTRVTTVKGWCPRPLDEGDEAAFMKRRREIDKLVHESNLKIARHH